MEYRISLRHEVAHRAAGYGRPVLDETRCRNITAFAYKMTRNQGETPVGHSTG